MHQNIVSGEKRFVASDHMDFSNDSSPPSPPPPKKKKKERKKGSFTMTMSCLMVQAICPTIFAAL